MEIKRNRKSGLPSGNRPNELLRLQQHAYGHYRFGRCTQLKIHEHFRIPCPVCRRLCSVQDLSEDHAPQRKQRSRRFGEFHVVVLDCKVCNSDRAGAKYEAIAAELLRGEHETSGMHSCEIHGQVPAKFVDLDHFSPMGVLDSSDLKTAFLIAFATLGYRWALDPSLNPVVAAIQRGVAPAPKFGAVGILANRPASDTRHVVVSNGAVPSVFVIGMDGLAVRLPYFSSADLRCTTASQNVRTAWPYLATDHLAVRSTLERGQFMYEDPPNVA